jgi:hypothetical protein
MHSAAFTLLGSTLYVFGGITQKGQHLNSLISLDLDTHQWSMITPNGLCPRSRWGSSLVAHEGSIYLFGGFGDSFFSDLWKFDPTNDTWTEIQPLGVPPPRHYHTAVVWEAQLYIIGGYRGSTFTSDIWSYEFATNRWLKLAGTNLLSNRRGHSCVVLPLRRSCIVFGGRDDKRRLNDVIEFKFDDSSWSVLRSSGDVPDSRVFHAAFLFCNSMFSFGGLNIYNTNDILEYVLEPDSTRPNFKAGLRIDYSALWKSESMSDVKFVFPPASSSNSNPIHIPAHKVILFSASEHFRRLFATGMRESTDATINIDDMNAETFSEVLHFIYTGSLHKLTTENVLDLLVAADKFLITDLTLYLERALAYILGLDNINNILTLTSTLPSAQNTFQRCLAYIRAHITGPALSKCKRSLKKIDPALYKELKAIHKEEFDKETTRRLQQEEFLRVAKAKATAAAQAAQQANMGISAATSSLTGSSSSIK